MGWKIARGAIILLLAMAAGFAFGRFGIGEGYLKRSVAAIKKPSESPPVKPPSVPPAQEIPEIYPDVPPLTGEIPEGPEKPTAETEEPKEEEGAPEEPKPAEEKKPAPAPGRFALQAGSFDNEESARQHAEALEGLGYAVRVTQVAVGAKVVHRVLAGSYATEDEARAAAEELRSKGFEAFISRQ
jgi:cell division protein FtsN